MLITHYSSNILMTDIDEIISPYEYRCWAVTRAFCVRVNICSLINLAASFTECQQKISLSTNVDGKLNIEEGKQCSPQQQRSEDF